MPKRLPKGLTARDHEGRPWFFHDVAGGRVGYGHVCQRCVTASAAHGQNAGTVVGLVDPYIGDHDARHVAAAVLELDAVVGRVIDIGVSDCDTGDVLTRREDRNGSELLSLAPEG